MSAPLSTQRSALERDQLQQIYVRVCRDSGFQMEMVAACKLAAQIAGKHPLEIWLAMPSLDVMFRIADGTHPAAHRVAP